MTVSDYTNVLQAFMVCILGFVALYLVEIYRLDSFRQKMFAVRDELFDYAADGNISFDDPAYQLLREQMNAIIRFGHNLTLYRLVITWLGVRLTQRATNSPKAAELRNALDAVADEEVRAALYRFRNQALSLQMERLITGSPILLMVAMVAGISVLAKRGFTTLKGIRREVGELVMIGPIAPDLIEDEAACFAY